MTETYVKIEQDLDPPNPRTDWDNLGTILYTSRDHLLGDKHIASQGEWLSELIYELKLDRDTEPFEDFIYDLENDDDEAVAKALKMVDDHIIGTPVYAYIHGMVALSANPFHCPWDSGQSGYIYVTKKQVREEWNVSRVTKKLKEQVIKILKAEIETFSQWHSGDVWGVVLYENCPNCGTPEVADSCWGYYGHDYAKEVAERDYPGVEIKE